MASGANKAFVVKVGDTEYDVDAPDERTAWNWANAMHSKQTAASETPLPARPANLKQPEPLSTVDTLLNKLPTQGPIAEVGRHYADAAAGMSGLMRGGANLLSEGLGEKIWPKAGTRDSVSKLVGSFADPVSLAIGGGVMKALPYLPVLSRAATQTAPAVQGGGALAIGRNAASGGAAGLAIGGLSDEGDAATGAGIGAGLNVVLPGALSAAGRGIGKVADLVSGRWTDAMASGILRSAAGNDLPAIKAALQSYSIPNKAASENLTAAQAASGIKNDIWNALDELAKRGDKDNFFSRLTPIQRQEVVDGLSRIAGGANQTEARNVAARSKGALNAITGPMREAELGAANTAGTIGGSLQSEAGALASGASSKVADVRRLEGAKRAADRVALSGSGNLAPRMEIGMPRLSGKTSYGEELSNLAERLSQKSADDSLILGEGARFKQMQVDSLADHGLRPLTSDGIIQTLSRQIADPKIGTSDLNSKVLGAVRDKIEKWTNSGGVIDANALYGIRKSAVNEAVEQLMGPADPKAKAKMAAGLLNRIKPVIDDAVERAGGTGWRNYLKTFEEGMTDINKQKMGAKALDLFTKEPAKLESLASGNEPKVVEKIFKTEFDLRRAIGDKANPIDAAAAYLSREREILEGAARGKGGLDAILEENIAKFKLPNWINAKIAVTNRALSEIEKRVNKSTMDKIQLAMRSGQSAHKMLSFVPRSERSAVLAAILRGQGPISGSVVSGSQELQNQE